MRCLVSLEAARVNAGYKQKEVASKLNVHVSTIQRWEKDSSGIAGLNVNKMAALYGVSPDDIFLGKKNDLIDILRSNAFSK